MEERSSDPAADEADEAARYGHLRAEQRDSMFLLAAIRRVGGPPSPVKVRNLSPGGMMAESETNFARGETVEVELRGIGWVTGKVAWGASGRFGVTFEAVIDPKLARKPVAAAAQPTLVRTQKMMWRPGLGIR